MSTLFSEKCSIISKRLQFKGVLYVVKSKQIKLFDIIFKPTVSDNDYESFQYDQNVNNHSQLIIHISLFTRIENMLNTFSLTLTFTLLVSLQCKSVGAWRTQCVVHLFTLLQGS